MRPQACGETVAAAFGLTCIGETPCGSWPDPRHTRTSHDGGLMRHALFRGVVQGSS